MLPLLMFAILLVPLWLMSSRQRKAQRAQQDMQKQLGVGDEVRTHSGFYGLIAEEYDDVVILETEDGSQTKWARAAIATRVDPEADTDAGASDTANTAQESADAEGGTDSDFENDTEDGEIPGVTSRSDDPDSSR